MKYYVYILFDGKIPFYVGKGCGNRMYDHFRKATKTKLKSPLLSKIRSMVKQDKKIKYFKYLETNDENFAFENEILLIESIGRKDLNLGTLLNLTNGGEGVTNYIWTESHKENLSKSIKKAISEGRFLSLGKFKRNTDYKQLMKEKLIQYWSTEDGLSRKKDLSKKGKDLLVNGKRVLSDEARDKMRQSAIRTNELKKNKHNIS